MMIPSKRSYIQYNAVSRSYHDVVSHHIRIYNPDFGGFDIDDMMTMRSVAAARATAFGFASRKFRCGRGVEMA